MFFKSKLNIEFDDKARLEFFLGKLADQLGNEALSGPVLIPEREFFSTGKAQSPNQIIARVGEHLRHDVDEISVREEPQVLNVQGGGG